MSKQDLIQKEWYVYTSTTSSKQSNQKMNLFFLGTLHFCSEIKQKWDLKILHKLGLQTANNRALHSHNIIKKWDRQENKERERGGRFKPRMDESRKALPLRGREECSSVKGSLWGDLQREDEAVAIGLSLNYILTLFYIRTRMKFKRTN